MPQTQRTSALLREAIRLRDILNGRGLNSREITNLETLLTEFSRGLTDRAENPQQAEQLRSLITELKTELTDARSAAESREIPRETTRPSAPQPADNQSSPAQASHDSTVRSQVLNGTGVVDNGTDISISVHDFKITIPLNRLIELAGQRNVTAEQVLRAIPAEPSVERATASSELLGRLLVTMIVDKLIKEIVRELANTGEISRDAIRRVAQEITTELIETVAEVKTKAEAQIRRDGLAEERREEVRAEAARETTRTAREGTTSDPTRIVEVVYDRSGNVVRIDVAGKLKNSDLAERTRNLVNSRPAELVPRLAELAASAIQRNPAASQEIIRFISQVAPAVTPAIVSQANSGWLTEPILVELIKTNFAVAQAILERSPQTALPALLKESARLAGTSNPAKPEIDQLIVDLARSAEGQKYILGAFASNQIEPLITTEAGKTAIVETVRTVLREAKAREFAAKAPVATLKDKKGVERLASVAAMVADANHAKINTKTLTLLAARGFLEFVAQSDKVIGLIGPRNMAKLEKQQTKGKAATAATAQKPTRLVHRTPIDRSRTVRARTELRSLIQNASDAQLAIPKELFYIIGNHYAGLAGFTGIKDNRIIPAYQATQMAEESRANSSLRRVLQVMEAEMAQGVARGTKAPAASAPANALSAEVMFYGLVMRRVRADLNKADQVIKALRAKGYMKAMVDAIKEGNVDSVLDLINNVVLEAGVISGHQEMTEDAVLQAIGRIEDIYKQSQPQPAFQAA